MIVKTEIFLTKEEWLKEQEYVETHDKCKYTVEMFKEDCIERLFDNPIDWIDRENIILYISDYNKKGEIKCI